VSDPDGDGSQHFSTEGFARRVEKPWGHEIHWTPDDRPYAESWLLMNGRAMVVWDDGSGELIETELQPGLGYSCQIGQTHRLVGITDCDILEVSTPEIGTTQRLEDDYARPDETEELRSAPGRGWAGE
jgi:hypothetical protein